MPPKKKTASVKQPLEENKPKISKPDFEEIMGEGSGIQQQAVKKSNKKRNQKANTESSASNDESPVEENPPELKKRGRKKKADKPLVAKPNKRGRSKKVIENEPATKNKKKVREEEQIIIEDVDEVQLVVEEDPLMVEEDVPIEAKKKKRGKASEDEASDIPTAEPKKKGKGKKAT